MSEAPYPPAADEVVPETLREFLRWDHRHDAMAEQIVTEHGLTLPQHRELIRQLTFVRVQQGMITD
jgi:hypothetical protein